MADSTSKLKVMGGFRVLAENRAGAGAEGSVYRAVCEDDKLGIVAKGTEVALKVMLVQDEDRRQWRKLEKRTKDLMALNHPNIVKYYGCFSEQSEFNDIYVVVQEFLKGETLKERLAHSPCGLDVDEGLRIAKEVVDGLICTTEAGIVHRDIKPANIFLCSDGHAKLIDFEIARQEGGTATTAAGNIRGSFDYMAPDFTDPNFHGDVRSDVFSMGVVLHEMLSGKTPYMRIEGADDKASFAFFSRWSHSLSGGQSPIHVSSRIRNLLANTGDVFMKALSPVRKDRYAGFAQLRKGIDGIGFRHLRNGKDEYRLLQRIGKGGFGEVFKARLLRTGQVVAVKRLLKGDYAKRFRLEKDIMKKLDSPCFVRFVDFFESDAGLFIVMDFLEGMPGWSLRDAIKRRATEPMPQRDVLIAFERYAYGLNILHTNRIYHRDIKPSNLYYPPGHPENAAIMDLGIARDETRTQTVGQVPGTLDYMPPEIALTDSRGDSGMDIYALGLCLYESLSGKPAYPRLPTGTASYSSFFERARSGKPPSFDDPKIANDKDILSLLRDMTELDPKRRLNDAEIVAARINSILAARQEDAPEPPLHDDEPMTEQTIVVDPAQMMGVVKKRSKAPFVVVAVLALVACGTYFALPYLSAYMPGKPKPTTTDEAGTNTAEVVAHTTDEAGTNTAEVVVHPADEAKTNVTEIVAHPADEAKTNVTEIVTHPDEEAERRAREEEAERLAKIEEARRRAREEEETMRKAAAEAERLAKIEEARRRAREEEEARRKAAEREVEMTIPDLATGVTCWFEGNRTNGVLKLRPGGYSCTYRKVWHIDQIVNFEVKPGKKGVIGGPAEWKAKPVTVKLPKLDKDVRCTVDGGAYADGITVDIGRRVYKYQRPDYKEQGDYFVVEPAESVTLPSPAPWTPTAGLANLNAAEKSAKADDLEKAKRLLELADVTSPGNIQRRNELKSDVDRRLAEKAEAERKAREEAEKLAKIEAERRRAREEAEAKRKEEEALKKKQADLLAVLKKDMETEPVETRQTRLDTAKQRLGKAVADKLFTEDEVKPYMDSIAKKKKWIVGKIVNNAGVAVKVGDHGIAPGSEKILTYDNGLPANWACSAAGYENKALPAGFDGKTVTLTKEDLVPAEVEMNIPELGEGVTCLFDGKLVKGALKLRPGRYSCTYKKDWHEDKVVNFDVQLGTPGTVNGQGALTALPVPVQRPVLANGVECFVDDERFKDGLRLEVGPHVCEYRQVDHESMRSEFTVNAAPEWILPKAPVELPPTKGLKSLIEAEKAVKEERWDDADKLIKESNVVGRENVDRKVELGNTVKGKRGASEKVKEAREYFNFDYNYECVKAYYEACQMGYALSDEDTVRFESAYKNGAKELDKKIKYCEKQISIGRNFAQDLEGAQKKLADIIKWHKAVRGS